jgi:hypothetical protein
MMIASKQTWDLLPWITYEAAFPVHGMLRITRRLEDAKGTKASIEHGKEIFFVAFVFFVPSWSRASAP